MNLEDESASLPNYEEDPRDRRRHDRPRKKQPDTRRGSSRPVILYVTILFAAAFILMLVSFFMQQRSHTAIIEKNNVSITELQQNNQELQLQVGDLQEQLDKAKAQLEEIQKGNSTESNQGDTATLQKQRDAMDYLRELQRRYTAKDFASVRSLLAEFQQKGLANYLPKTTEIQNVMSPAEKYQEIVNAVS